MGSPHYSLAGLGVLAPYHASTDITHLAGYSKSASLLFPTWHPDTMRMGHGAPYYMVVKSSDSPVGKCFLLWIRQKSWLSHMVGTNIACWNENLGSLLSLSHHSGGSVRDLSTSRQRWKSSLTTWPLLARLKVVLVSSTVLGWSRSDYSLTILVLLGSPFPGSLTIESKLC